MSTRTGVPDHITLAHGNGGLYTHSLVEHLFRAHFQPDQTGDLADSAVLALEGGAPVFTTDSHVVQPLFFPGGDMGSLAVNGTVNDLAVCGARPLYLSAAFIIEEGFPGADLERIVVSMARAAREAGVRIVTGDTKVVERGSVDGLFINTAGVGVLRSDAPKGIASLEEGYEVLVTGSLGDHGMALYAVREGMEFETDLQSDCASVASLCDMALSSGARIALMRDPTRGGLATTLNEFVRGTPFTLEIREEEIPVKEQVRGLCEILGFDPLHVANEGRAVLLVHPGDAASLVERLRTHPLGRESRSIGRVSKRMPGRVLLKTTVGGERILDMLSGDMLPRIC